MGYVIDALDLWNMKEAEDAKRLESLPKCHNCGEPIQQECAVRIDGHWYCDHCLDTVFREVIPD